MKRLTVAVLLLVFIAGFVALAGCTKTVTTYVCSSGREVPQKDMCPINKVAGVKKIEAEGYAKNYVSAYFMPYGGKAQMVSAYLDPDKGDFFATFIVATKDGAPYETVVLVDGVTGKVNCTENCKYI
jgi:hypothetical protein